VVAKREGERERVIDILKKHRKEMTARQIRELSVPQIRNATIFDILNELHDEQIVGMVPVKRGKKMEEGWVYLPLQSSQK
jgi:Fe2+ or Zn2+ uptake regulation protein